MIAPKIPRPLPAHFTTCDDGTLCRVDRRADGFHLITVRENYRMHHRKIETVADMKASLRAGEFAWPGGYACFFITDDGAALSFKAARKQFRSIAYAIRHNMRDGWRVIGMDCMANCDDPVFCDHTGKEIQ